MKSTRPRRSRSPAARPPAIYVVSHKVKHGVATLKVKVPAAGRLLATARGLAKAAKTAKSATTLTLKLHLTKSETAFLRKHKHRKFDARIRLTFTPRWPRRQL